MITRRLKLCTNVIMDIIVITKVKIAGTENIIATGTVEDISAITMKKGRGGKREGAGRKCENPKIPFNRRLNEELINKLKTYASENGITETEALERAIQNL